MTLFRIAGSASEQPLAPRKVVALQEPIYRAGVTARWIRIGAPLLGALWMTGRGLLQIPWGTPGSGHFNSQNPEYWLITLAATLLFAPLLGGLCGLAAGLPLAAVYRWVIYRRIRHG